MSLDAFFIGIIQVLVYAGAVMVLFLFIIMLLDLRAEERRQVNVVAFAGGAPSRSLFSSRFLRHRPARRAKQTFPPLAATRLTMCVALDCSSSANTICRFKSSAC